MFSMMKIQQDGLKYRDGTKEKKKERRRIGKKHGVLSKRGRVIYHFFDKSADG